MLSTPVLYKLTRWYSRFHHRRSTIRISLSAGAPDYLRYYQDGASYLGIEVTDPRTTAMKKFNLQPDLTQKRSQPLIAAAEGCHHEIRSVVLIP